MKCIHTYDFNLLSSLINLVVSNYAIKHYKKLQFIKNNDKIHSPKMQFYALQKRTKLFRKSVNSTEKSLVIYLCWFNEFFFFGWQKHWNDTKIIYLKFIQNQSFHKYGVIINLIHFFDKQSFDIIVLTYGSKSAL